ncbi:MAG: serine/threonine protein kinase/formylglycine-generating enzyme required for sulfatase activity [Gammaproteobacteria bacterium]|jgi:serine/threonine protein kinase/formylglycine-generating enzyme required for sulfatase activity
MTSWTRIRKIFEAAVELEPLDREQLLSRSCDGDPGLRAEVLRLLAADESDSPALDQLADGLLAGLEAGLPSTDALVGRSVGAYRIVSVLAAGGMGTVYEAQQEQPARRVAVKVMKRELISSAGRRRFDYEAATLARLRHPGIAQIFEAGSFNDGPGSGDVPFFAMEFIEGARSIIEYASREELDLEARLELFAKVCSTVHYGHQQGVIHRDLKPRNILVDYLGRSKVIDFGIARAVHAQAADERQTQAGEVLGTLQYMSPEQMAGDPEAVDTRSDIYALGVVLYELLTGCLPFPLIDRSIVEAARIVETSEPVRPDHVRPDLSKDLVWITLKALEQDRERRYTSAAELADEIQRVLAQRPVHAVPPSTTYRLKKFLQRHRREAIIGGLLLATVTIGPLLTSLILARVNTRLQTANARYGRLADSLRLEELTEHADQLWPATPERVEDLRAWMVEATAVVSRLETHRQTLAALERTPEVETSMELRWQRQVLVQLVSDLMHFSEPEIGTFVSVQERLTWARSVVRRTIAEHQTVWNATCDAIATSALYGGLEVTPQVGLIPLGTDPHSGLWEFAHLQSGAAPARRSDGTHEVLPETGFVFTLIPGGSFLMGALPPSTPEAEPGARDPFAGNDEAPVRRVELAPFFLSKYETTRAQWKRLSGDAPSYFTDADLLDSSRITSADTLPIHPVEQVSWHTAIEVLQRHGLTLPTEAQWEYSARAGTATVWWTGDVRETLRNVANIADRSAQRAGQDWPTIDEWPDLDDGYPFHAPVDAFAPNPFGLHHMLGNIYEWCLDGYADYTLEPAAGTGYRTGEASEARVLRGGSFVVAARKARCADRAFLSADAIDLHVGLRIALAIRPADSDLTAE